MGVLERECVLFFFDVVYDRVLAHPAFFGIPESANLWATVVWL